MPRTSAQRMAQKMSVRVFLITTRHNRKQPELAEGRSTQAQILAEY